MEAKEEVENEEGRREEGWRAEQSCGDIAHEDLRNSILSIFNLQMSIPKKGHIKLVKSKCNLLSTALTVFC